jgi:hypothetical protein
MYFAQTAQQGGSPQHISHGGQLDNKDSFPELSVVRAAVAYTTEPAGLVSQKMAAIIVDNHDSLLTISCRQNEAEAKLKATRVIGRGEAPI